MTPITFPDLAGWHGSHGLEESGFDEFDGTTTGNHRLSLPAFTFGNAAFMLGGLDFSGTG